MSLFPSFLSTQFFLRARSLLTHTHGKYKICLDHFFLPTQTVEISSNLISKLMHGLSHNKPLSFFFFTGETVVYFTILQEVRMKHQKFATQTFAIRLSILDTSNESSHPHRNKDKSMRDWAPYYTSKSWEWIFNTGLYFIISK
jgi:hypothetical protein